MNEYEIIIEQKLRHRFVVKSRTSPEATLKLGGLMLGENPYEAETDVVEVSRRMVGSPSLITVAPAELGLDTATPPAPGAD